MRVRQPGVQREHRHLDRERQEEGAEQPPGCGSQILRVAQEVRVAERVDAGRAARVQIQHDDRDQHEQRAQERIDEELDRRVQPVVSAPHPDDEIHGDEHHFPHHIEEEEIERDKDADHARREHEQERVEAGLAFGDIGPAAENREWHQERRQQHEEQRDPIQTDCNVNAPRRDPGAIEQELHPAVRHERPPERYRDHELHETRGQRDVLR